MRGDQLFRKEHCGWGSAHYKDFKDLPFPRMTRLGPEGRTEGGKGKGQGDKWRRDFEVFIHGFFGPP